MTIRDGNLELDGTPAEIGEMIRATAAGPAPVATPHAPRAKRPSERRRGKRRAVAVVEVAS